MKPQTIVLALAIASLGWSGNNQSANHSQTVNSILGDVSFIKKFGHPPDVSTNEDLRIRTHLEYVETLLRQKDLSGLSKDLQQKRLELLDMLHQYWTTNVFPRNHDFREQRVPCFIDKDGRICAVGYLIERSVGRDIAEQINSKHTYETIFAMNDEVVDGWIAGSGLTKEECALVQPSYGGVGYVYPANYNRITTAYGISSSLVGAINLSLSTINAIQIAQDSKMKAVPLIGLATGAGQVLLGALMMPEEKSDFNGYTTNESQKILSMINIGMGATSIILSIWNLATTPEPKDNGVAWNIYSFPTTNGSVGMGLSLSARL